MNALPGSIASSSPTPFDIIAIGCASGGLDALKQILGALPANFPVPIVIVSPHHSCHLVRHLNLFTFLNVIAAREGDSLHPGQVYMAIPDHHLVITEGATLSFIQSPEVHSRRPSIDVLFASVAKWFRKKAIGIVLSGRGEDGADGIRAIKEAGGVSIVQDEATSDLFGTPQNAIKTGKVDRVFALKAIAPLLKQLCSSQRHLRQKAAA